MFKELNKEDKIQLLLFYSSIFLRNISIGIFFVLFNLYIVERDFPKNFLGMFLAVGNFAMAFGGIPAGIIIDKYNKNRVLAAATFFCGILFALQAVVPNRLSLIVISFFYGLNYAVLMGMTGPFLMQLGTTETRPRYFSFSKSITLVALTLGSVLGGFLSRVNVSPYLYQTGLLIGSVLFIAAVLPLLFIVKKVPASQEGEQSPGPDFFKGVFTAENMKKYSFVMVIFFIMGYTVILTPYLNLYFNKRFWLEAIYVGYFMSVMQVSAAVLTFMSAYVVKKIGLTRILIGGLLLLALFYSVMLIIPNLYLHMGLLLLINGLFHLLVPFFINFFLERVNKARHGIVNGFMNVGYNLGDSLSTYHGGLLLLSGLYNIIFLIIIGAFLVVSALLTVYKKIKMET
ncbi:MAG: MFS transporter [Candidatus Aminicenantes bacterium]|nr:MAG: MFS transporter [Candidatus Aminicenantes bacterium]